MSRVSEGEEPQRVSGSTKHSKDERLPVSPSASKHEGSGRLPMRRSYSMSSVPGGNNSGDLDDASASPPPGLASPSRAGSPDGVAFARINVAALASAQQRQQRAPQQQAAPEDGKAPEAARPSVGFGSQLLGRLGASNRVHPEPSPRGLAQRAPHASTLPHASEITPCSPREGEEQAPAAATPAAQDEAAGAQEEDEDDVCPVCLDELPNIKLDKCLHRLCISCAKDLCRRHKLTPALCPMCRMVIPKLTPVLKGTARAASGSG